MSQVLFELSPDTKIHGFVSALIFGRKATASPGETQITDRTWVYTYSPFEDEPFQDVFPIFHIGNADIPASYVSLLEGIASVDGET